MTLAQDLARDYKLEATELRPHPGGFGSDCFIADETWSIKIWRSNEPQTRPHLLSDLRAAGLPVPAPLATTAGESHAWSNGRPYAVFDFIRGRTA